MLCLPAAFRHFFYECVVREIRLIARACLLLLLFVRKVDSDKSFVFSESFLVSFTRAKNKVGVTCTLNWNSILFVATSLDPPQGCTYLPGLELAQQQQKNSFVFRE